MVPPNGNTMDSNDSDQQNHCDLQNQQSDDDQQSAEPSTTLSSAPHGAGKGETNPSPVSDDINQNTNPENSQAKILDLLNQLSTDVKGLSKGQDAMRNDIVRLSKGQDAMRKDIVRLSKGQDAMRKDIVGLSKGQDAMRKDIDRLSQSQGLLVEDKARKMASRQYGEDFSKHFIIKSLYDVVKLIANANTKGLKKDDYYSREKAVQRLKEHIESKLSYMFSNAVQIVIRDAEAIKTEGLQDITENFKKEIVADFRNSTEERVWDVILGKTINFVKTIMSAKLLDEDESDFKKRQKQMQGTFKRKLERLKKTADGSLLTCSDAGVLILSALAFKQKKEEQNKVEFNIFDYKEEIECDLKPQITIVNCRPPGSNKSESNHATILVGEIKTSTSQYTKAVEQMTYTADVLNYGIELLMSKPDTLIKKGQLYVFHSTQGQEKLFVPHTHDNGMSLFVKNASH